MNKFLKGLVILAVSFISAATWAKTDNKLITVLNPTVASKMAERLPLSPRLDTLDGKTLYMVDINWGGPKAAYSVFEQMKAWLAQHMPAVKVVIVRKSGSYFTDDPALWQKIAQQGDAAIVGISG